MRLTRVRVLNEIANGSTRRFKENLAKFWLLDRELIGLTKFGQGGHWNRPLYYITDKGVESLRAAMAEHEQHGTFRRGGKL